MKERIRLHELPVYFVAAAILVFVFFAVGNLAYRVMQRDTMDVQVTSRAWNVYVKKTRTVTTVRNGKLVSSEETTCRDEITGQSMPVMFHSIKCEHAIGNIHEYLTFYIEYRVLDSDKTGKAYFKQHDWNVFDVGSELRITVNGLGSILSYE